VRARKFDELEFRAMAWLINQALHPRGYHFAMVAGVELEDGPRWVILGDGSEVATGSEDEDLAFRLLNELLAEANELFKES
jgi:hypothetical protein